jgi:glycosyltransferase involved in cell wall biosynthesis
MRRRVASLDPSLHVDVVPFGVDLQRFRPAEGRPPAGSPLRVGTVKWLEPKYGVDDMIRAVAIARARGHDVRLSIAGDGTGRSALERLALSLDIEQHVEFVGRIPHDSVPDFMRRLDVFLALSTQDSESFGVSGIEAAACGIPAIVSDKGGLPEVVLHETTGYVVPARDPGAAATRLCELDDDVERRIRLGARGREHVEQNYSWQRCVDALTSVRARVANTPSRKAQGR